jgi:hypothetical protein
MLTGDVTTVSEDSIAYAFRIKQSSTLFELLDSENGGTILV